MLLFDGLFLLRPELCSCWDYSIFAQADFQVTLERAAERDPGLVGSSDAIRDRYTHRYVPGQRLYVAEERPQRQASVVVDNNDPGRPRITHAPRPGHRACS